MADRIGYPPNVILSARVHVSARRAGDEPARAVKAHVAGKPPVQGGVLTWGGHCARRCRAAGGAAPAAILHVYCLQSVTLCELCEWKMIAAL